MGKSTAEIPETLVGAVRFFADKARCRQLLIEMRWPGGVCCPHCGSLRVGYLRQQRRWKCYEGHARPQFSHLTGTIFEHSPLGLDLWLPALWQVVNCKNGVSSCELARALGVTQKTAWFMAHRIRYALRSGNGFVLAEEVEVDETFVGGRSRYMHAKRRRQRPPKTTVVGLVQRGGKVLAEVVSNRQRDTLWNLVLGTVLPGAMLYTDAFSSYHGLGQHYGHQSVDHSAGQYVDGAAHTNTIENFWSGLKRALKGTYIRPASWHLPGYLAEQCFRFNTRRAGDGERFQEALTLALQARVLCSALVRRA